MSAPSPVMLYHFTHVENVADIVANGLRCDSAVREVSPDFIEVGDTGIKARRRRKTDSVYQRQEHMALKFDSTSSSGEVVVDECRQHPCGGRSMDGFVRCLRGGWCRQILGSSCMQPSGETHARGCLFGRCSESTRSAMRRSLRRSRRCGRNLASRCRSDRLAWTRTSRSSTSGCGSIWTLLASNGTPLRVSVS